MQNLFASLRLCETIFFKLSKKESLPQAAREYSLFFSQRREDAKRSHTTFASLREYFFLSSQRKKAFRRLHANTLFFSRKEEKAQREIVQTLRLCAFARLFFYSRKGAKPVRRGG